MRHGIVTGPTVTHNVHRNTLELEGKTAKFHNSTEKIPLPEGVAVSSYTLATEVNLQSLPVQNAASLICSRRQALVVLVAAGLSVVRRGSAGRHAHWGVNVAR